MKEVIVSSWFGSSCMSFNIISLINVINYRNNLWAALFLSNLHSIAGSFNCELYLFVFQEAAFDADKVFLAAIDKFDAMMSKGNVYAPDGDYLPL